VKHHHSLELIFTGLLLSACEAQPAGYGANGTGDAQHSAHQVPPRESEQRDLRRLLGADKRAVAQILGEPTSCHSESRGESCAFGQSTEPGEATELFFINGRATNVTLPNYDLPFEPASLTAYGISAGEPVFSSPAVLRWYTSIGSTPVEVDMFLGAHGRISYLYVMARE
jgi:hypothetical protein